MKKRKFKIIDIKPKGYQWNDPKMNYLLGTTVELTEENIHLDEGRTHKNFGAIIRIPYTSGGFNGYWTMFPGWFTEVIEPPPKLSSRWVIED